MILLIDADSALYRAGCANETREYIVTQDGVLLDSFQYKRDADAFIDIYGGEAELVKTAGPVGISLYNLREVVAKMLAPDHTSYEMYVGGKGNFRFDIFPEYKSNRDDSSKPAHLEQMKKHLQGKFGAELVHGEEVDDRVSWRQMQCIEQGVESCIVSLDKDLNNTMGWHYNYVKGDMYYIDAEQADLNFARQCLTGDSTDGIPGLKGVGAGTAKKILPEYREDWLDVVKEEYKTRGHDMDYLTQQGRCLWMRRKPDELWSAVDE